MSTRERWIVYPLLFLTLGIVMRDKIRAPGPFQANEVTAGQIHCGQLQVDQWLQGIAVRTFSAAGIAAGNTALAGRSGNRRRRPCCSGHSMRRIGGCRAERSADGHCRHRSEDKGRADHDLVARRSPAGSAPAHRFRRRGRGSRSFRARWRRPRSRRRRSTPAPKAALERCRKARPRRGK